MGLYLIFLHIIHTCGVGSCYVPNFEEVQESYLFCPLCPSICLSETFSGRHNILHDVDIWIFGIEYPDYVEVLINFWAGCIKYCQS